MNADPGPRPVFVYDGDCGICGEWVTYWRRLTGDAVIYRPYQQVGADYPDIPVEQFARAVHLFDRDGTVLTGAAATFALYRGRGFHGLLPLLYRLLPGFAPLVEFLYRFLSRHRGLLAFITHGLWGRDMHPPAWRTTSWLFLRLLGLVYLGAFVSFGMQITGLIGSDGILPVSTLLAAVESQLGHAGYWLAPTVFWFSAGDAVLTGVCSAGALFAVLIVLNRFAWPALFGAYVLYLSLVVAGQTFMAFQWDLLLLEAGVLALFLRGGHPVTVWLFRWLVFRFFFLGGMVKLLSGDPSWDSLTALDFHFETQPLPTLLAWYAHHLPQPVLLALTAATLIIELLVPFLVFAPRRARHAAAWCFIALQIAILLTGNYNFFNVLTLAICLFLFDDAALARVLPARFLAARAQVPPAPAGRPAQAVIIAFAALAVFSSSELLWRSLQRERGTDVSAVSRALGPCRCVNGYGPFAVMTTVRHEIEIEGSRDGTTWQPYRFRYKPGDTGEIGGWIIPHQPRVDWQMWFAALSRPGQQPWFQNLLIRLLQGSPAVTGLLAVDPFSGEPPRWVRARLYRYEFTTPAQRAASGDWWVRTATGDYFPPASLPRS